MHDWILKSISLDWKGGTVRLVFSDLSFKDVTIVAESVTALHVPRIQDWGPSDSVNEVTGPIDVGNLKQLSLEMQSGDVIEVTAGSFHEERERDGGQFLTLHSARQPRIEGSK